MEIIRLSGYDIPEKVAIGARYLVPKALKEAGLQEAKGMNLIKLEKLEEAVAAFKLSKSTERRRWR